MARPPVRTPGRLRALAMTLLRIVVLVGVLFPAILFLIQDWMIFHPRGLSDAAREGIVRAVPEALELTVDTPDGIRLHGWLRRAAGSAPAPLVLYFGGNAEEVSWMVEEAGAWPGWSFAAFNYRGYGLSGGRPGEKRLFADALTLYDRLVARDDVDGSRVVAFGRSLGTGVAVHLAAHRSVAGVILATPYDSVAAVAQGIYPWVPVRLLIRHPFDSLALAPRIGVPALFLAAEQDRVIPVRHAQTLRAAWGGPVHWVLVEGADHDGIAATDRYRDSIGRFLDALAEGGTVSRTMPVSQVASSAEHGSR